ncbi:Uncharacterised protein [Mycobacteroides abscessus subsp. abscessus]|uniref:hypothetical protein n=1 Tax=Mycobacteroides abscessus TaxID=36809 RepID=UPI000926215F|nr:hypothetical protein [Mycobacteroides abscessus]SHU27159.1 Uncharacterised protein [Mycobacteroides abscessus subsp. abscessus]
MITRYRAHVYRDGPWCMIAIPELHGLTQARRPTRAAAEARSYIAACIQAPIKDIAVDISEIDGPPGDILPSGKGGQ